MIGNEVRHVCHLSISYGCRRDDHGSASGIARRGDTKYSTCNCWYTLHSIGCRAERLRSALPMHHGWSIVEVASGGGVDSVKRHGCNDNNRNDHHHDHRAVSSADGRELRSRPLPTARPEYATSNIRTTAGGLPGHREQFCIARYVHVCVDTHRLCRSSRRGERDGESNRPDASDVRVVRHGVRRSSED